MTPFFVNFSNAVAIFLVLAVLIVREQRRRPRGDGGSALRNR